MITRRLLQGDPRRRSRLHDFEGHRVELAGLRDLPAATFSTALRKLGKPHWTPWWPYPAIRALGSLLEPSWRVLEFGSGASTPWLAARAASVVSMESNPAWYERVRARLARLGLENVDLRLREGICDYVSADPRESADFDLVVVDGAWRDRCAHTAVARVRPGGYIYLDNSDVPDPDHRSAVETVLQASGDARRFVGFSPGTIAVNQGLLVRVSPGWRPQ